MGGTSLSPMLDGRKCAYMKKDVLECWFAQANRRYWFDASPDFDELVRQRLAPIFADAIEGRLDHWKHDADGALALCILFDQAPRNLFRGSARAFATDTEARSVATHILAFGFDRSYRTDDHRVFCYLPFEHSEDIEDQRLALQLLNERTADDHRICATSFGDHRHVRALPASKRRPRPNLDTGGA